VTLPIRPITWPAALQGKLNGLLPLEILHVLADLPNVTLIGPAMRSWLALSAAANQASHVLHTTGNMDSYRSLAAQETLFRARYTMTRPAGATESKTWLGHTWWLRPGMATAAVPGTSNHGWGLAVDVANASGALLAWLVANAWTYGWSWELQSEPWHIRYCPGDTIPQAVLAYEQRTADVPDFNTAQKIDAVFNAYETVQLDIANKAGQTRDDAPRGMFPVPLTKRLDSIDDALKEVLRLVKGVSP
jgi:hypothetical protein